MYQELFDQELGTPPPSTVDVDGVVARGQRRRRYRRAAVAGLSLAVAVGVGLTATTLPGGLTPRPGRSLGAAGPGPFADPVQRAEDLTVALKKAMDALLPHATFLANRGGNEAKVPALVFNHRFRTASTAPGGESYAAEDDYYASADVRDGQGTGSIDVEVGLNNQFGLTLPTDCSGGGPLDAPHYSCDQKRGPAGEAVVIRFQGRGTAKTYTIFVVKPDGTGVMVDSSNLAGRHYGESTGDRPAPPLTVAQAVQLALNPAFTAD